MDVKLTYLSLFVRGQVLFLLSFKCKPLDINGGALIQDAWKSIVSLVKYFRPLLI